MAWCVVVSLLTLRECRIALGQSQTAFAVMLGVSHESYRTWDAGRRATPPKMLARARALATHRDDHELLPLPVLALLIGVHVKTLRAAARDGRLPVTYDTRTTFRRLRACATSAAARAFRRSYYGRTVRPADRRAPLTWSTVPVDYDVRIRAVRRSLGLSQARFAARVGAARKAVVYQWEAGSAVPRRCFGNGSTYSAVPTKPGGRARLRRVRRVRSRLRPEYTQRPVQESVPAHVLPRDGVHVSAGVVQPVDQPSRRSFNEFPSDGSSIRAVNSGGLNSA